MPKMVDEATLDALEAVEKNATRGPWEYDGMHNEIITPKDANQYWLIVSECQSAPDQTAESDRFDHAYDANFDLIAQGRNALPDLLATIRALKAALERITTLVNLDYETTPPAPGVRSKSHCEAFELGVDAGRYGAAGIAQAALCGEEAPCSSD